MTFLEWHASPHLARNTLSPKLKGHQQDKEQLGQIQLGLVNEFIRDSIQATLLLVFHPPFC